MSCVYCPCSCGPAAVPGISAARLKSAMDTPDRNLLLVDVRDEWEYKASHIQGAIHMPLSRLEPKRVVTMVDEIVAEKSLPSRDQVQVVAICLSAHRSPPACRLIQKEDPTVNVVQLDYGMANWWRKKYPTTKS